MIFLRVFQLRDAETGQTVYVSSIEPGHYQAKVGSAAGIDLPLRVRITIQPPERYDIDEDHAAQNAR